MNRVSVIVSTLMIFILTQISACGDSGQSVKMQDAANQVLDSNMSPQTVQQSWSDPDRQLHHKSAKTAPKSIQAVTPATSLSPINADATLIAKDEGWAEWHSLASGFVARKRKMPETDTAQVLRRYARRDQVLSKLRQRLRNRSAFTLTTQEAGLYQLPISLLAELMGQSESHMRELVKQGRGIKLDYLGTMKRWHYDSLSDALYFVTDSYETMFTDENRLKLSLRRWGDFAMRQGESGAKQINLPVTSRSFAHQDVIEQDNFAYPHLFADPDADYWVWQLIRDIAPFKQSLQVAAPSAAGTATMRLYLSGASDIHAGDDHRVTATVTFGDVEVTQFAAWDGFEEQVIELTIDQSMLASTAPQLVITTELAGSWELLDRIEIDYQRNKTADNDRLLLKDLDAGTHTITGFQSASVVVIESPFDAPLWREDVHVTADGNGLFAVSFSIANKSDVLLTAATMIEQPLISADTVSNLRSPLQRADYLVIAPRGLAKTAQALQAYRQTTHGQAIIAWLDDIYDEFSFGRDDPQAISQFLAYVSQRWRQVPKYVTLIGRGTADPKNILGKLDSWMPLQMAVTPWGLASSDQQYFDIDDDGVNDFAGGRISIVTDDEGVAYVDKVKRYESLTFNTDWMRRVILTADNPDSAGDFHADIRSAAAQVSQLSYHSEAYFYPQDDIANTLTRSSSWQSAVVGYMGHGLTGRLDKFLNKADVTSLNNRDGQALFLPLTCSVANTNYAGYKSLTEVLVFPDQAELDLTGQYLNGAIAAVAPTGKSLNSDAAILASSLYNAVLAEHRSLGEALSVMQMQSKEHVSDFMLAIYSLQGDPAIVLH